MSVNTYISFQALIELTAGVNPESEELLSTPEWLLVQVAWFTGRLSAFQTHFSQLKK